jgi:hypothetical protein
VLIAESNDTGKREISRCAIYYVVSSLIAALSSIGTICPSNYQQAMAVYISGLMVERQANANSIAERVGLVSHDQLTRMLGSLNWNIGRAAITVVKLIEMLGGEGYLIVDDVLIPKPFAKLIAFCGWDWDHSQHRNVFGQRLVFVVWSNGYLVIPLLFAFWQKDTTKAPKPKNKKKRGRGRPPKVGRPITDFSAKARARRALYRRKRKLKLRRKRLPNGLHYRSKNELARILVWKLVRAGIKCQFILFDNWYASKENLTLFERLKLYWVSRVKGNVKVYFNEQSLTVKGVAEAIKKANYHYYDSITARARSFQVQIAGRWRKLTVIKNDTAREAGSTKYLLTNALHLTNQEHIFWYRSRWAIEVFFRDIKQYLNFTTCEARCEKVIISHVILVCIAYTLMQLLKSNEQQHSINRTINTFVPLLLLPDSHQFVSPRSNGSFQVLDFDFLLANFRTRFFYLPHPECPLIS